MKTLILAVAVVTAAMAMAAPAPRPEPPPTVTAWTLQMDGGWRQETTFRSDGTCESPQFGKGRWVADGDVIYFSERDDTLHYAISIDWGEMTATGGPGNVQLKLKLGPKATE